MSAKAGPTRGLTHHPGPPTDVVELDGYPARAIEGDWFRAHVDRGGQGDRGCWWFSSIGGRADGSGRFDLPTPDGTCYLASTEEAAARERVGTQLRKRGGRESVTAAVTITKDGPVVVTRARLAPTRAANLPVKPAQRWVNRSLWVGTGIYAIAQAWAVTFRAAGFGGIVYEPRFTGGARVRALAIFGRAGRSLPVPSVLDARTLGEVLAEHRVRVVDRPLASPAVLPASAPPPAL